MDFDINLAKHRVYLDVDLPEIEDIPAGSAEFCVRNRRFRPVALCDRVRFDLSASLVEPLQERYRKEVSMKIMTQKVVDVVEDVRCDVCGDSTSREGEYLPQFGMLKADWGYGSRHDGERYELHLCEGCFFSALATLKPDHPHV